MGFAVVGQPPSDLKSRRDFAWASTSVFLALSTISLLMRFAARRKQRRSFGKDDYLITAGYLIALMPCICIYIMLENGMGYHMKNLDQAAKVRFLKADFALQRANQPALACIKISILVFYVHIFTTRPFKIAVWANIIFTLLWAIIGWCINLTVCHPVSFFYDRTIPGGYCRSQQVSGAVNGGLGVLGDVLILALPLFMIHKLQLNPRKKMAISGIFCLGGFVCIASGLRIWAVSGAAPRDVTYAQATASTWTAIEMQVAILSANLPTLAPLFEHFFRNQTQLVPSSNRSGSKSRQTAGPNGSRVEAYSQRSRARGTMPHDGFERISDDLDAASGKGDSMRDLGLDDRTILVKTELLATVSDRAAEDDSYELAQMQEWGRKGQNHEHMV